jgi:hypothetical protein
MKELITDFIIVAFRIGNEEFGLNNITMLHA